MAVEVSRIESQFDDAQVKLHGLEREKETGMEGNRKSFAFCFLYHGGRGTVQPVLRLGPGPLGIATKS
jgi:hypothetical protein